MTFYWLTLRNQFFEHLRQPFCRNIYKHGCDLEYLQSARSEKKNGKEMRFSYMYGNAWLNDYWPFLEACGRWGHALPLAAVLAPETKTGNHVTLSAAVMAVSAQQQYYDTPTEQNMWHTSWYDWLLQARHWIWWRTQFSAISSNHALAYTQ